MNISGKCKSQVSAFETRWTRSVDLATWKSIRKLSWTRYGNRHKEYKSDRGYQLDFPSLVPSLYISLRPLSLLITPNILCSSPYYPTQENDNYRPWKASRHVTYSLSLSLFSFLQARRHNSLWFFGYNKLILSSSLPDVRNMGRWDARHFCHLGLSR